MNVSRETLIQKKGGVNMIYVIVTGFIVLDLVTGVVKALKEKNFTSSAMRDGLFHKCASLICVIFGVLVDYAQSLIDLGITIPIATGICCYITLMECGSIIEKLCAINQQIAPDKLKSYFLKLKE